MISDVELPNKDNRKTRSVLVQLTDRDLLRTARKDRRGAKATRAFVVKTKLPLTKLRHRFKAGVASNRI